MTRRPDADTSQASAKRAIRRTPFAALRRWFRRGRGR
jgi:hypothetical protein